MTANLVATQYRRTTTTTLSTSSVDPAKLTREWAELGAHFHHKRTKTGVETIIVEFPVIAKHAHTEKVAPIEAPDVLIIDDDVMILQTVSKVLGSAGLRSVTSTNRKSAVEMFRKHSHSLRLVILDALLPSTHGSALLRLLRRINPSILVLGFSGASTPDIEALRDAGANQVLRKPLHPQKILFAVQELLGGQRAA